MKISLFILLFSLGLFVSCKKKDLPCDQTNENFTNDTILPSDYLMTYPGSWWEYNDGTLDSCSNWENVTYKEVNTCNGCVITNLDHHYLPRSTRYGILDFESVVNNYNQNGSEFYQFIGGQNIGDLFYFESSPSSPNAPTPVTYLTYRYLENHFATYEVQNQTYNDVIVTRRERYTIVNDTLSNGGYRSFYAKNVGLIKEVVYNNIDGPPVDSIELVNHFIAPH